MLPARTRTSTTQPLQQANVWMAIFGFIGNYFWTHYFFNLLGAAYTLPSHTLNGVRRPASVHAGALRGAGRMHHHLARLRALTPAAPPCAAAVRRGAAAGNAKHRSRSSCF
jgi:hypothetical protein